MRFSCFSKPRLKHCDSPPRLPSASEAPLAPEPPSATQPTLSKLQSRKSLSKSIHVEATADGFKSKTACEEGTRLVLGHQDSAKFSVSPLSTPFSAGPPSQFKDYETGKPAEPAASSAPATPPRPTEPAPATPAANTTTPAVPSAAITSSSVMMALAKASVAWDKYDTDRSGTLTLQECEGLFNSIEVNEALFTLTNIPGRHYSAADLEPYFKRADKDNSGDLTSSEFLSLVVAVVIDRTVRNPLLLVESLLGFLDKDKNGVLEGGELKSILGILGYVPSLLLPNPEALRINYREVLGRMAVEREEAATAATATAAQGAGTPPAAASVPATPAVPDLM